MSKKPTLEELDAKISTIKDNHLAHMAQDIDRIEVKVDKMDNRLWAVLILIIAGLLAPIVIGML